MNWILDANTIIYIVKAGLADTFIKMIDNSIKIDTSVYNEVIEKGEEQGYEDALIAKRILQKYQIPIIPVDISSKISIFRDPGETSCHILTNEDDICISSDKRAIQKLKTHKTNVVRLDEFFLFQVMQNNISKKKFLAYLDKLEKVYATTPERKVTLIKEFEKNE